MANLHINFHSDCISRSVYPVVFLPDMNGWRDVPPPYPTLYFLPGYSGGGLETAMFSNFSLFSMRFGVAVVLCDGENSFYTDDEQRGAMFSQYVGQELVEVTRSVLPLSRRREDTFIGGISMGGYGAAALGLHYTEIYAKIALFSPALEADTLLLNAPEGIMPPGLFPALFGNREAYASSPRLNPFRGMRDALDSGRMLPGVWMCCGEEDLIPADAISILSSSMMQPELPLFSSPV